MYAKDMSGNNRTEHPVPSVNWLKYARQNGRIRVEPDESTSIGAISARVGMYSMQTGNTAKHIVTRAARGDQF